MSREQDIRLILQKLNDSANEEVRLLLGVLDQETLRRLTQFHKPRLKCELAELAVKVAKLRSKDGRVKSGTRLDPRRINK